MMDYELCVIYERLWVWTNIFIDYISLGKEYPKID